MFHRSCQAQITTLLARIADLENRNEDLLRRLFEEQDKAHERERELADKLLAIANPLAARMAGVGARPTTPTPPSPTMPRQPARDNVKPVLQPRPARYRSMSELMEEQRRRTAAAAEADAEAAASPPAEEPEVAEPEDITYPRSS